VFSGAYKGEKRVVRKLNLEEEKKKLEKEVEKRSMEKRRKKKRKKMEKRKGCAMKRNS